MVTGSEAEEEMNHQMSVGNGSEKHRDVYMGDGG